jgi:Protein of unknown function (DUF3891)
MLVRDRGESWQLVRQPDHADLSGQFAAAWGGDGFAAPQHVGPLTLAATRHDDGWAVFDRRPAWDPDNDRPRNFLDVPIPVHLAFYRACIAAVSDEDGYAGLMVSMHGSGIYTGRYGTQPSLGLANVKDHEAAVKAFVSEQEEMQPARAAELGVSDEERWTNYKLLQIYDRLSLSLCLREWEGSDAEADTLAPVPVDYEGNDVELRLEPLGPWRIRIDPYPFAESPARFTLVRKILLKGRYEGNDDFRRAYLGTRAELVDITLER